MMHGPLNLRRHFYLLLSTLLNRQVRSQLVHFQAIHKFQVLLAAL